MLDKLVEFIKEFIGWFKCAAFMHSYERGVLLRFGAPHDGKGWWFRPTGFILEPGRLYLHWPFHVEQVLHHAVCPDPTVMPEQSLTTKDGEAVTLTPVVTFEVTDVKVLLLEVSTLDAALADAVSGVVATMVVKHGWAQIVDETFANEVTKKVRNRAKRYGLAVIEVQFRDMSRSKTIRLIQTHPKGKHDAAD